ncbi:aldolase/citrate lyase family protein [Amycolatopsis stemonae]
MLQPPRSGSGTLLARLRAGELTLMLGIRAGRTLDTVHTARSTGHHAVMVDLEHSAMSTDTAATLCTAADALGLTPIVRIPEREYGMIGRLLDGGARGIIAPRVDTAQEAERIARACRFPPRGQRSPTAMPPPDTEVVVLIMVETPEGIDAVDAIASVDGVDMLVFGANDFTAELGVPGRYDDPRLRDAVAAAAQACRDHGKLLMVGGINDPAIHRSLVPLGVCPLVLTGNDTALLHQATSAAAARAQAEHRETPHHQDRA